MSRERRNGNENPMVLDLGMDVKSRMTMNSPVRTSSRGSVSLSPDFFRTPNLSDHSRLPQADIHVEELEAQIQANAGTDARTTSPHLPQGYQTTSAPSPTALLDLLSSTASAQASAAGSGGFRDGATESIMMMSGVSLPLVPLLYVLLTCIVDRSYAVLASRRPHVHQREHQAASTSTPRLWIYIGIRFISPDK